MIPKVVGENLLDGWMKANDEVFFNPKVIDFMRPGVSAHSFHNYIKFKSATRPPELWELGFKKTKWGMLNTLYFDPEEFGLLINRVKFYKSERRGKRYIPDIGMQFKTRLNRTGACLMGFCIRFSIEKGWEVEVFSRASEMTSRWAVDLAFLYVMLKEIGSHVDFEPEEVTVHWTGAGMFQSILTAPLYLVMAGKEDYLLDTKRKDMTSWQQAVYDRYITAFNCEEPRYQRYKSQKRSTTAYQWLKQGEPDSDGIILVKDLKLPKYPLDIDEDFFTRKGFR